MATQRPIDVDGLFAAKDPQEWFAKASDIAQQQFAMWAGMVGGKSDPTDPARIALTPDKRFSAPEWEQYPLFKMLKDSYLQSSNLMLEAMQSANLDDATKKRMLFFTRQYIDAVSPANFAATNPEVLKLAIETKGESFAAGFKQLADDLQKGRISMTDEEAFVVGENIAITPGAVVFENELIQLIQYRPLTGQVHERPLLMVPPCINKYYIMDLRPENSFVRYAIEQGHTVFLVSWRNVSAELSQLTWDDYLRDGALRAIEVVREICRRHKINVLGFCVGGTILACALAVLAARGKQPVASLTLLTTLLEFSDVGDIGHYVDRQFVEEREAKFADGGVVPGKELAIAFSSLRANDLIWSYVVNNYLKGKMPDAFDLLYWNSDPTNLPGRMFAYYLRHLYLENELIESNRLTMCGQRVNLAEVNAPTYVFAAVEDHIVPWTAAYRSAQSLGGPIDFVLGASGHIAGSMNPASKNKRNYWAGGKFVADAQAWKGGAESFAGSWWVHWSAWLESRAGHKVPAPVVLGNWTYREIEAAPGRYVRERADA
jgi:polyhydroxyalkanoate synthase subunit PhaC